MDASDKGQSNYHDSASHIHESRSAGISSSEDFVSRGFVAKQVPSTISRDEMNLAEFPLTVLSTRTDTKTKTLEFSDTIYNKNGHPVQRRWIITGADKFGLPTASDEELLLGLLKLTVDSGFTERKVFFTRYELLRILRWTTEGRSYSRLQNALDRLSGVRIKASNAFFDNESKAHSTRNFGIIDAYEINDGRDANTKPSFFTWSDVLFKSFQAGFIKKLDLDYYLELTSAVSRRLYRYLDKHFWYKGTVKINLFTLAHEKIGISRNYKYPSSLRQQLDPAFDELKAKGFIEAVEYVGKGSATEVCIYARSGKKIDKKPEMKASLRSSPRPGASQEKAFGSSKGNTSGMRNSSQGARELETPQEHASGKLGSSSDTSSLVHMAEQKLIERGIKPQVAKRLVENKTQAQLARIGDIIEYVDELSQQKSRLVSKNPQGFLYRAVEKCDEFSLPSDKWAAHKRSSTEGKEFSGKYQSQHKQGRAAESIEEQTEAQYLVFRKKEIQRLRREAEPGLLGEMSSKIQDALKNISGLISPEKFSAAVEHAVDEKLAKLFAVPSFEEWSRRGGQAS